MNKINIYTRDEGKFSLVALLPGVKLYSWPRLCTAFGPWCKIVLFKDLSLVAVIIM